MSKQITIKITDLHELVDTISAEYGFCKDKVTCDCAHCVAIRLLEGEGVEVEEYPYGEMK